MSFEVKDHDGLGRIGVFSVNNKSITTPNIAVVVNPNELIIPVDEMVSDFGVDLIITNAYIIRSSKVGKEIEKVGLHKFLKFPGIIYTDSGTYQMFSKGGVEISNEETLSYQAKIGSDIHTPLDLFTTPGDDYETAKSKLAETTKRINAIKSVNFSAPIQGGVFMDLRKEACNAVSKVPASVYPIGGIVPLMINYDFKRLIEVVIACKKELPFNVPVHAFGAGHPLIFALLAYAGVDLFDSASYALYAREGKYITETGTKVVKELQTLPCDCPVCSKHKPSELTEGLLARHNLHALMREVRLIRTAIAEGRLFELVYSRAMSHPSVFHAFKKLLESNGFISESDTVRKSSALFYSGELCASRPEIFYANSRLAALGFKKPPKPLKLIYPFGQSMGWDVTYSAKKYSDIDSLRLLADYQFGVNAGSALLLGGERLVYSSTGRLHQAFSGNELLFVLRASDGYFALHKAGAKRLKKFLKKVFVPDEFREFYIKGGNVFSKHLLKADSDIKPKEDVGVFCGKELIAVGEAVLAGKAMTHFKKGLAVEVREGIEN
ncbi:MAG TPA: tRNA guanosine(15) transglycosylase TgtA [Candidatus Nanoarchaeia archaeon]|nr:tRNA guanosine(15) transglycosylase TgtA [Candidatus Nanoarchaeia archaeon]